MAFTNYYHKNQQRNYSESPSPDLSIAGNQSLDDDLTLRSSLRLKAAVIGGLALNSGRKVFNSVVDATGNATLKRNVSIGGTAIATTGAVIALGPVALLAPAVSVVGNGIVQAIEEFERKENERYDQQLIGQRVKSYNKGGGYID